MAIATANVAVNMNNWQFYETTGLQVTPTQITETHVNMRTTLYLGTGFSGDAETGILSGELHQIYHYLNGVEQWRVTGLMARDATVVGDYLADDSPAVLSYLFAGSDTFNGSASSDQLNGYNGNDKLNGNGSNDVLNGGAGNDILNGGGGTDQLIGGGGKDTLIWDRFDSRVDGGGGSGDILKAGNLDLTTVSNSLIRGIEVVNMTNGANNTLTLNAQDLLDLSSSTNVLKVLGNAGDRINIVGPFTNASDNLAGFNRYTFGGATLQVDNDITSVS